MPDNPGKNATITVVSMTVHGECTKIVSTNHVELRAAPRDEAPTLFIGSPGGEPHWTGVHKVYSGGTLVHVFELGAMTTEKQAAMDRYLERSSAVRKQMAK